MPRSLSSNVFIYDVQKYLIRFRHLLKSEALTELYSLWLLVLLDTVCVFLYSGMCPLVLQVVSNTFTLQHNLYPSQSALKWRDDRVQWVAVNTHVCSLNTIHQLVVQVPTMEGLNVVRIISLLLTSKSKQTVPVLHLGCSDVLVNSGLAVCLFMLWGVCTYRRFRLCEAQYGFCGVVGMWNLQQRR